MTAGTDAPSRAPVAVRVARLEVALAIVGGSVLLGLALRFARGSAGFYICALAVAAVWLGAAALVRTTFGDEGPPQRFRTDAPEIPARAIEPRLALGAGAVIGAVMFGVFVAGAEIGRRFSFLADPIDAILRKADGGPVLAVLAVALVNGVAEEVFFRGALVDVSGTRQRRAYVAAVIVYIVVTSVSGNAALTVAAVVMGAVFALERWWTNGLAAPIATHLVWSTLMILAFPR